MTDASVYFLRNVNLETDTEDVDRKIDQLKLYLCEISELNKTMSFDKHEKQKVFL